MSAPATVLFDDRITAEKVCLLDAEGVTHEPGPIEDIRQSFDSNTHRLVQLNGVVANGVPVCKIMEDQEFEKVVAEAKLSRKSRGGRAAIPPEIIFDSRIQAKAVAWVDEKGKFNPSTPIWNIKRQYDNQRYRLVQVAGQVGGQSGKGESTPVCKLMDAAEFERHIQRIEPKKASSNRTLAPKELEVNWAIDEHDLSHRLNVMRSFLEQGRRVELKLAPKRRGRRASIEEAENLLKKIRNVVSEVDGATEWQQIIGKPLEVMLMQFQGKATSNTRAAAQEFVAK